MLVEPSGLVEYLEQENKPLISAAFTKNRKFFEETQNKDDLIRHIEGRVWSELDAAVFMAEALASSARDLTLKGDFDILESMAKQIWDECRHARYMANVLTGLDGKLDKMKLNPSTQKAYAYAHTKAKEGDLLSLHSANMLTGEAHTLSAFQGIKAACEATGKYPELLRICKIVERDEIFHVNNGRRVVKRYATTAELQEKAKEAAEFFRKAKSIQFVSQQ